MLRQGRKREGFMDSAQELREQPQPLTVRHVLVVVTGILCLFGPAALVINTWSVFLVPVTQTLGVSSGDFTLYVSLLFLSAAVCSPFAGNLMHKRDLRVVISAAVMCCALGLFMCQFYTEPWQFYVSGILEGAGICVILFLTPSTLIGRWFNVHNGLLIGICAAMSGAGAAVWTMVAGFIIADGGWREAYLVFGIVCAVIALPATMFFIRSYPEDVGLKPYGPPRDDLPEGSVGGEGAPMRPGIEATQAFRMPVFYTLMITFMITNATAQLGNYLPTYLYHLADLGVAGLTTATVVIMASVIAACLQTAHAIAKICLGQVVDHSQIIALALGCGCGFVGILLVWQGYFSQPLIYLGAALFGVHFAVTNVLGPSFALRIFGPRDYPKIYSRITSVMNIMPAVVLVVFSALSEASWDALFIVVLLLIAIVFCTGMATIVLGRRANHGK